MPKPPRLLTLSPSKYISISPPAWRPAVPFAHLRPYHSHEHPDSPSPFSPPAEAILRASLAHVHTHGFTPKALTLGAADCGYPPVSTNLFPRGPFELVNYHLVSARLALNDRLRRRFPSASSGAWGEESSEWRNLDIGQRVKTLVLERLGINRERELVGRWQEVCSDIRPSYGLLEKSRTGGAGL